MKLPKVVFTGITGLLGGYFLKKEILGFDITGISNKNIKQDGKNFFQIDITKKDRFKELINQLSPDIIIHAASIGNVDYCEKNPEEALKVNVEGTKNIIAAAKEVGSRLVFISSNAVYDGESAPYDEESSQNPVDVYGKTKVEGERLIKESGLSYAILRLITMYGWPQTGGRGNPVTWVIDNLKKGQKINVVCDVYNNHLWAAQAAEVIWKVIKENKKGEYNIAGGDCISRYNLALKVAEVFNLDSSLINSVGSDFFKGLAKRPKNTCFDTTKMEKRLGIKPLSVDEGLKLMKQEGLFTI